MKVIHAYRRKEATTVELFGLFIEFKPNDKKDVVAEVALGGQAEVNAAVAAAKAAFPGWAATPAAQRAAIMRKLGAAAGN